jgi:phosphoesterase RecJ-like protein
VLHDRAATAEILFDWIEALGLGWDPDLAAIVYTGLLTDTGGFRYSNTTPQLLRKAATLVEAGVKSHEIADLVLETVTLEQIRLLKLALSSLQVSEDGKMAWMCLRREDLQKLSVSGGDLDGIVNYARNITGVEVGMLFRETEEGTVKVSLRSRARVDVGKVAKSFGGGGHARASGCTLHIPMEEAVAKVKSRIREEWGEE